MLILTRKVGERIKITAGSEIIWVSLRDIRRRGLYGAIGIEAAPSVIIDREEVAERKDFEAGNSGRLLVCSDFHEDPEVPDYCEGCQQPRRLHTEELPS